MSCSTFLAMNYPRIASAELLETHGDRLFLYCWSMLRSRETAQAALRDTLLAAPAGATGSRLYSLARAACGQHRAVPAADADEAPVCRGRNDADNRLHPGGERDPDLRLGRLSVPAGPDHLVGAAGS